MADRSVFRTAVRTPSAQMDADFSTLHPPEAAGEVVDEGCRRVRERGQIDIVGAKRTFGETSTSAKRQYPKLNRFILSLRQLKSRGDNVSPSIFAVRRICVQSCKMTFATLSAQSGNTPKRRSQLSAKLQTLCRANERT